MSILNLGLQIVGLMRKECSRASEEVLKNCNSLKQIRAAVAQNPEMADDIVDSIEPVRLLIYDLFQRLALKGNKITMGTPTTETEMQELNTEIQSVEAVDHCGKVRKGMLKDLPRLKQFIKHCCQVNHYQFCIKNCGKDDCQIAYHLDYLKTCSKVYTCYHTLFQEKMITIYHFRACMVLKHQRHTDLH